VARADTLEALAQGIARQVRQVARADASAVRWSDEANRKYLLLASDCLPQSVIDEELCIPTGDCLCGQPQGGAATRVIPILPDGHRRRAWGAAPRKASRPCQRARPPARAPGRRDQPLLPRYPRMLADEDRVLLETIASHLAGAIEGLRAAALQRETAVAEERSFIARELHDSIAQSLAFLKIQLGLLRNDIKSADRRASTRPGELDAGVHESLGDVRELLVHFRTRTNSEDIAPA
jgi:two-component system nitrate/nitrite sensor histidine kinase NarX